MPWSETLDTGDWHYGDTLQELLSNNGTTQTVKATIPAGTVQRFVRLEVQ